MELPQRGTYAFSLLWRLIKSLLTTYKIYVYLRNVILCSAEDIIKAESRHILRILRANRNITCMEFLHVYFAITKISLIFTFENLDTLLKISK